MPDGPLIANASALNLRAAGAGLGLARTFAGFATVAVAQGRLEQVLDDWSPPFPGPFLYYPGRRHMPAPLRAFVDFLRARRRMTNR